MPEYYLTEAEQKLADVIWEEGPMASSELVRLCGERYGWKKSTVYTLLKRLEGKELFGNMDGTVCARISRADFETGHSRRFVETSFSGSLPRFLAAFTRRERLTERDAEELRALIRAYETERRTERSDGDGNTDACASGPEKETKA